MVNGNGSSSPRRRWTPQQKLKLVIESLQSDQKLAELCRREGVGPTQVYTWRKQLLGSAEAVFGRPERDGHADARVEQWRTQNARMKSVIAEITAENLELKKTQLD